MTEISKPSMATAAAFVLLLTPAAFAQKHWNAPRIVTWNCSGCHGIDGNADLPYFPRLAGLNAGYTEQKMKEFVGAASPPVDELFSRIFRPVRAKPAVSSVDERINMIGIAHDVNTEEIKASVRWYAIQEPAPGHAGNPVLIEQGKGLFLKGLPAEGMLPCQSCHGANGAGIAKVPRLAGQNAEYLLSSLEKFRVGDRQHAPEMTTVVQHGNAEQFRALAAYLQSR